MSRDQWHLTFFWVAVSIYTIITAIWPNWIMVLAMAMQWSVCCQVFARMIRWKRIRAQVLQEHVRMLEAMGRDPWERPWV